MQAVAAVTYVPSFFSPRGASRPARYYAPLRRSPVLTHEQVLIKYARHLTKDFHVKMAKPQLRDATPARQQEQARAGVKVTPEPIKGAAPAPAGAAKAASSFIKAAYAMLFPPPSPPSRPCYAVNGKKRKKMFSDEPELE